MEPLRCISVSNHLSGIRSSGLWRRVNFGSSPTFRRNESPPSVRSVAVELFFAWITLRPLRWRWYITPNHRLTLTRLHGVASQKNVATNVRTSNPTVCLFFVFIEVSHFSWEFITILVYAFTLVSIHATHPTNHSNSVKWLWASQFSLCKWMGEVLERSSYDLIWGTDVAFSCMDRGKRLAISVEIAEFPGSRFEPSTTPGTTQERHCSTSPLDEIGGGEIKFYLPVWRIASLTSCLAGPVVPCFYPTRMCNIVYTKSCPWINFNMIYLKK
jgi:hypothetical protein